MFDHDMRGFLNDIFQPPDRVQSSIILEDEINIGYYELNNDREAQTEAQTIRSKLSDLLKNVKENVYPGSKHCKLSCLVHLYHLKCLNGWSSTSFSMLLEFLKDLLPEGNLLPNTSYQVKQIMANLGLGYEKIPICRNGCTLFWDKKVNEEICSICGASRWRVTEDNSHSHSEISKSKKKDAKILRLFPFKPRLQRLFESSKTADLMRWHHVSRVRDGKLRHHAYALAWKKFDQKFPNFSNDPRNIRLAQSSDGFNPLKAMNVSHSIWLVIFIPYNFPPWLVMKQSNFILSLIIPGPGGPGNKIDVYIQPLIKELIELWKDEVETYDAFIGKNFNLKATILTIISDTPGYDNLFGWSTKGKLGFPSCGFNTDSKWLQYGRKFCYMCHRRWLPADHHWRRDTRYFVRGKETRSAPFPPSGAKVLQ